MRTLLVFIATVLVPLASGEAKPGFFYYVADPEQPLDVAHAYTIPQYYVAPYAYVAPPVVTHYVSPCKNNAGLTVPCFLGPWSGVVAPPPAEPANAPEETVSEDVAEEAPPKVIEARKKRDAEAEADPESYYLGYGYGGYGSPRGYSGYHGYGYYGGHYPHYGYAYAHPLLYHGYGGCRNYLGALVPCAHGRKKRDAEAEADPESYYLGYGYGGYGYPWGYSGYHGYGYYGGHYPHYGYAYAHPLLYHGYGGCRNYLGALVPCAHGR